MNENSEVEHQLEEALRDVADVRHDLARDEAKLEGLEHRIEELAEELAHESKIKVNGRTRTVDGHVVSFEEVVKLAFPTGPTKPNTKFTVTYRNAAQVPATDELDPGQSVKVKPGHNPEHETIFNVTETVLS